MDDHILVKEKTELYSIKEKAERALDAIMARSIENEREVRAAREAAERATASGESVTAVKAQLAAMEQQHAELSRQLAEAQASAQKLNERCDILDQNQAKGQKRYVSEIVAPDQRTEEARLETGRFLVDTLCIRQGIQPRFGNPYGITREQTVGSAAGGGNAVPVPLYDGVAWLLAQRGFARQACTVVTMTSDTMPIPTSTTGPTISYPGENTAGSEANAALVATRPVLQSKKAIAWDTVSIELNEDATPGYLTFLVDRFTEAVTLEEDRVMLVANNSPSSWYGVLYATSVGSNTMGTGSVSFTYLDYANVVNTMNAASEHCQETGRWFMSSYVLNIVRKIRDADGQPLLAPMMAGAPATILGRPWNTTSVMPKSANDNAVSNPFLVYGDFKQGSFFGDRRQLEVAWSEHAAWKEGGLVLRVMERFAFVVALPAAFGICKTAAA